jgi:aryl-alcohol dehydrogenase-like predicted oxidoreductase
MGMLTGRYNSKDQKSFDTPRFNRGGIYSERITPKAVDFSQKYVDLAQKYEITPAHLALLWVKDQAGVTAPLCGPRTLDQIKDIVPLMGRKLSEDIMKDCDTIVPPGSAVANFLNSAPWMKGKLI